MYLHKWNEALIEWVNCLQLTPKITDLAELQDGIFFHSLLKQVGSLDEGIENDYTSIGFGIIYATLKKEFPLYNVCDIEKEEDKKLSYISSLLLLLSVTKGKTPIFRSHLCESVQHDSQVKIRCFLESCLGLPEKLDHAYLKALIDGDFLSTESPASPCQTIKPVLPKTPISPMSDFFDSPRLTAKLARDLRRLENENKVLLLEKVELEEELNTEKLKREQMEGSLKVKNNQVLKLREELQEFVQNTMALNKKISGNDRAIEIDSSRIKELESCIDKLLEEKSLISEEKEKLKEKLISLQSKSKEFEIRALYTENKNEELKGILSQTRHELNENKVQYAELEEKMRFLSTQHNMSIDSDSSMILGSCLTSPFAGGECLSHVVEVKLAEVEEENEKLREQIKTTMEQRERLREQLGEVKDKLEKAKIAQEAAAHENIKIQGKLSESLQERDHLCIALDEAKAQISRLQELYDATNQEREDISRRFSKATELNQQLEDEHATLKKSISEKQQDLNEMMIQLDLNMNENKLLLENNSKLNTVNKDLDDLLSEEKQKSCKFNENLKQVEEIIITVISAIITKEDNFETLEMDYHLPTVDRINKNLKMLQTCDQKRESEKKMLEIYIKSLETKVKDIQQSKQGVYEKLIEAEERNNKLENCLKTINDAVFSKISAMVSKGVVENFLEMKSELSAIERINRSLKILQEYDQERENEKDKLETFNKTLESEVKDLLKVKQDLQDKLFEERQRNSEVHNSLKCTEDIVMTEILAITGKRVTDNVMEINSELKTHDGINECLKALVAYDQERESEKENLEKHIKSLENKLNDLYESKQVIVRERSDYKMQISEKEEKIYDLEIRVGKLEEEMELLTEQISEKTLLIEKTSKAVSECTLELDVMKRDKDSFSEQIAMKEKELGMLKDQLVEEKNYVQSLKSEIEHLISEKKQLLYQLHELKTSIDQKELGAVYDKSSMESKISYWQSRCEIYETKFVELEAQKSSQSEQQEDTGLDQTTTLKENTETVNIKSPTVQNVNKEVVNRKSEKSISESIDKKDTSSGSLLLNPTSEGNVSSLNFENVASMSIGDIEEQVIEGDRLRQLGTEEKLLQLINSWHDVEVSLEKVETMRFQLRTNISSLWEAMPSAKLRCPALCSSKGSVPLLDKDMQQSTEVIMRLENMIHASEKHLISLEKEHMDTCFLAVSWCLSGIQDQFEVASHNSIDQQNNRASNLHLLLGQKEDICKSLDTLKNKLNKALEEVNSIANTFCEIEQKCGNAKDALEYLKCNGLLEEEILNEGEHKITPEDLKDKNDSEIVRQKLEELDLAKRDLEIITSKTHQEHEEILKEKEGLLEKIERLTSCNNLLKSELEQANKKEEEIVKETIENVKKVYEGKLLRMKEKLRVDFMEDLAQFNVEKKMRLKLEESCKKYRDMFIDYEKRLSDATARNKDLMNKIEILNSQKSSLQDKLLNMRKENASDNIHNDFKSFDISKSQSVEQVAEFFARGDVLDRPIAKFISERSQAPDEISRAFSKESLNSNPTSGMGQLFSVEDEDGELFNATYLVDLKAGKCDMPNGSKDKKCNVLRESNYQNRNDMSRCNAGYDSPNRRLTELRRRNTLCLPHLKSSYPTETQLHDLKNFSEESVKGNFSLKAPLLGENQPRRLSGNLCGDLRRRKDIGQTTYMKPGPPTPGKNRRASLQASEHGVEQGKIQSTPGRFRSWFARGKRTFQINDSEQPRQSGNAS